LLRSAAGYQAFRRRHPRGMVPEQVAAFLLSDPCFPRSAACCLGSVGEQLTALRRRYGLKAAGSALQFLDEIGDELEVRKVKAVIANGELHRFNDFLQRGFIELTRLVSLAFFGHAPAPAEPLPRSPAPA
ncbi:MAG TPA: alpha-E domain-containing protein, partial [Geminicoccaceae bacterium]|nr:alpha-E domain-containing protein [Geminicoccaceae bacterium]